MRSTRGADLRRAPARRAGARVALLLLLLLAPPARASGDAGYLTELLGRADAVGASASQEWLALLHDRRPPLRRGVASHVDDPEFFFAPDGAHDPRAELEATLRAFFAGAPQRHGQTPLCAFPARAHWLRERLAIDPARLPIPRCPAWEEARAAVGDVASLTLVFAEAFMNSPASMFGHTLLRVDTAKSRTQGDLLAWAINFAGATGPDPGPLYAAKGLFGFYPGYYSIAPYYQKVKEYGDWENRDLWEYHLTLDPEEIEQMLRHLWELQNVRFDYYYADENCSYQLLALLQTARPGLDLTAHFPLWVIPVDTLRAVVQGAGLLEGVSERPSAATQLRHEVAALSRPELALARRVAAGRADPDGRELAELAAPRRALVLTVAYDLLRYEYLAGDVLRRDSAALSRRILLARSRVEVTGTGLPPPPTPRVRPDEGHGSARAAVEAGWQDDRAYVELRVRPALHDLLDPQGGWLPGAEIQFLDLALRVYADGDVRMQEAVLLDLVSLAPWERPFRPISWRFDTGLRTRLVSRGGHTREPEPVWRSRGGAGISLPLGEHALFYALPQAVLDVGGALDHDAALGAGGGTGIWISSPGDAWRGHLFAEATRFEVGDRTTALAAGVEQRVALGRDLAVEVHGAYHRDFGAGWAEAGLRWTYHF